MTSQAGQQAIAIHILPNISRSAQLVEYNLRNNFLENSFTKCGGKLNYFQAHF